MSEKCFRSLEKINISKFERCNSKVYGVTGNKLEMLGSAVLKFKIGKVTIKHKFFIICNIVKPLVLGSDLLMGRKDLNFKIDCSNKILSIGNLTIL